MGNLIQESPKDEKVSALLAKDKPIHKWDDKDVDENDTTESWEDLDEPAPLRLHVNAINHRVPCNKTNWERGRCRRRTGFIIAFSTLVLEPNPLSLRSSLSFPGHLADLECTLESISSFSTSSAVVDNQRGPRAHSRSLVGPSPFRVRPDTQLVEPTKKEKKQREAVEETGAREIYKNQSHMGRWVSEGG
ncbi:hypothetical protein ACFX19_002419 [Malus domestica]